MSTTTKIEWTDRTWNPVTGCTKVSKGCKHCYAERLFPRPYPGRKFTDVRTHDDRLTQPLSIAKPQRIFVNSMSDLFHEDVPFEFIDKVFAVMSATDRHTYQVLTKRPARMLEWFARLTPDPIFGIEAGPEEVTRQKIELRGEPQHNKRRGGYDNCGLDWPLGNVWLGVSVEDQETADERIPLLLMAPAAVRFLSCEPLLDEVDLTRIELSSGAWLNALSVLHDGKPALHWTITGGESGPGARPCVIDHIRRIVRDCQVAGTAVFVKQLGAKPRWNGCAGPDEHWPPDTLKVDTGAGYWEIRLRDRKGGDMSEWPSDLRVRNFPRVS